MSVLISDELCDQIIEKLDKANLMTNKDACFYSENFEYFNVKIALQIEKRKSQQVSK